MGRLENADSGGWEMSDSNEINRLVGQIEGLNLALQLMPTTPENVNYAQQLVEEMGRITEILDGMESESKKQLAFWGVYEGN
jgi:hypothetical protein